MEKLISIQELSVNLKIPVQTLYLWRTKRYGPPGIRIGKHIRYRPSDVEKWLTSVEQGLAS